MKKEITPVPIHEALIQLPAYPINLPFLQSSKLLVIAFEEIFIEIYATVLAESIPIKVATALCK